MPRGATAHKGARDNERKPGNLHESQTLMGGERMGAGDRSHNACVKQALRLQMECFRQRMAEAYIDGPRLEVLTVS